MSEDVVGWGIMGCARIAVKNARGIAISPNSKLVAVSSRSKANAQTWCAKHLPSRHHQGVSIHGNYDDLLQDSKVKAVYLPTPTATHLELVKKIAAAGKHVMCEKPVSVTLEEMHEILRICRDCKVQFMDGVMFMHNPRLDLLAERINDKGDFFGEVTRVTSAFSYNAPVEFLEGGDIRTQANADPLGCLGDLGWYCIRIGLVAFQYTMPHSVIARNFTKNKQGVVIDLDVDVFWTADRSKLLTFHCSFRHTPRQTVEILFSKEKRVVMDDFVIPNNQTECFLNIEHFGESGPFVDHSVVLSAWERIRVDRCNQEAEMFTRFSKIIQQGKLESFWPLVTLQTQTITQAIVDSMHADGGLVMVQPALLDEIKQ